jgi:hypothetical protein
METPNTNANPDACAGLAAPTGSASRQFFWKQCYELGNAVHWALCDTKTSADPPLNRVTCPYMVLHASYGECVDGRKVSQQFFPALIVRLLDAHFAEPVSESPSKSWVPPSAVAAIAEEILTAIERPEKRKWHTWDIFAGRTVWHEESDHEVKIRVITGVLKRYWSNVPDQR